MCHTLGELCKLRVAAKVAKKPALGNTHSEKGKQVDARTLANRLGIDRKKALNTVRITTQRGVKGHLHPSLRRIFLTNDHMMRYRHLPHNIFTDAMFSGVKSKMENTCAQIFCTIFGWTRVHPMKTKRKAHEALSLVF